MLDIYGVGVRSGAITPQREDEEVFREVLRLKGLSNNVKKEWEKDGGVRKPVTIKSEKQNFNSNE